MSKIPTETQRSKASVDRPSRGDLQLAIQGLNGIFWALNMFVVNGVAYDVAHEQDLKNGIDQLIVAGQQITDDLTERVCLSQVPRRTVLVAAIGSPCPLCGEPMVGPL